MKVGNGSSPTASSVCQSLLVVSILLFLAITTIPSSLGELDQETRVFIQAENSKVVAQTISKIDQSFNNIDTKIGARLDGMETRIEEQVTANLVGALKSLAIGMFGMILVGLAAFKIIEYRLSNMRRIRQYEEELLRQQKEYEQKKAEADAALSAAIEKQKNAELLLAMFQETTGGAYGGSNHIPTNTTQGVFTPNSVSQPSPRLSPTSPPSKRWLLWLFLGVILTIVVLGAIFFLITSRMGRGI